MLNLCIENNKTFR